MKRAIKVVFDAKSLNFAQFAAALETELKRVNGRSFEHTFNFALDVVRALELQIDNVERLLPTKKAMVGVKLEIGSGYVVNSSYKYARNTTTICAEMRKTGWFITSVHADTTGRFPHRKIILTPEQDNDAVRKLRTAYVVK